MNSPSNATPGATPSGVNPSGATPSNHVSDSQAGSQVIAPAVLSATRPMYWSIRRELWENRSIYLAPLGAAAVFLFGFLISLIALPQHRMSTVLALDPAKQRAAIELPYEIAAGLIMGTAFIVGIFYSLEALYGERRDRSILFWKSLPVSDLTVVLSKLTVPMVILPLLSFVITVATQLIMLLLSSLVLLASGLNLAALWTHSSFFHVSLMLLYHIVTVHGLWYAPFYGWLLLVSAAAPRAPFVWAFLPPFVIVAVEKLTFNTSHFASMLLSRLAGPEAPAPPGSSMMDVMAALTPGLFLREPGLWIGLAIAAVFLFAAVRLRRYRGPI
jgi:ABC-2 type transport system permease protein